jgi:DNA-binding NarL/FixJ family response regulator
LKILLVDDHALFREGMALLLKRLDEDVVLLHAASCAEGLALCESEDGIDLVLLDLNMGGMHGFDGLALLRERHPGVPVVVMSSVEDAPTVRRALDLGAMGFIPKSSSAEIMLNALRLVLCKGIYLPPVLLGVEADHHEGSYGHTKDKTERVARTPKDLGLTPRQSDVLYLVLQGKPIKLICRELNLGETTVKGHVSAVLRALNVTTRTQAIVAAHELDLRFDDAGSTPAKNKSRLA